MEATPMTVPPKTTPAKARRARIVALLTHPRLRALTTDSEIQNRLLGLGLYETCSRCSGGGNYGPHCVDAGRCWGCGGTGKRGAKLNTATEQRVREIVEAGGLDTYAETLIRRGIARRALKGSFERILAAYSACEWYRYHYLGEGRRADCSHVNALSWALPRLADQVRDQAMTLVHAAEREGHDPIEALAAVDLAIAAVAQMDRAHAVALPRYAECRAEEEATKILPYPERFEAEQRHRAKWLAIAREIWDSVA